MSNILNIIIILMVLAAVVLSYFVYQEMSGSNDTNTPSVTEVEENNVPANNDPANGDPVDGTQPGSSANDAPSSNLTADEQAALNPPGPNASESELQAHFELIERIAVDEAEVVIGQNCAVSPVVLKTKLGNELTFTNTDNVPHTIVFNESTNFTVPANDSTTVPARFSEQGAGIYGYGCDAGTGAAGMMLVGE